MNREARGWVACAVLLVAGACSSSQGNTTTRPIDTCPGTSSTTSGTGTVRRYVVGTGSDGKSFTQFTGCPAVAADATHAGALWRTSQMPVDNTGSDDAVLGVNAALPSANGTVFAFKVFLPGET